MRLGISSFTYSWAINASDTLSLAPFGASSLVERAVEFGLDTIQIGDNLPLHLMSDEELHSLRTSLRYHGMRLEIGARGLRQDHIDKYLELAKYFQSPLIRFVTDDENTSPSPREIADVIKRNLPELRRLNVKFGIENHDRLKSYEIAQIILAVDDPLVGVCLDCVNSIGAGEGLEQVLALASFTINLHVKDFMAVRLPHKMGFTICGAITGTGMANVPRVVERIALDGRCESAILEQWVVPADSIEETVKREKTWAEAGVAYLKSLPQFNKKNDS